MAWTVTFFNHRVEAEILDLAPGFVARFIQELEIARRRLKEVT